VESAVAGTSKPALNLLTPLTPPFWRGLYLTIPPPLSYRRANMPQAKTMPEEPDKAGDSPASTGMLTPQAPEGDFASAKLDAFHAMKLLDRAIGKMGPKSEEGKALLAARAKLTKQFGDREEENSEFSLAEMKRMLATLAGPGEAPKPPPPQQQQQAPPGGAPPMAA
jgi:hypothetical protein